MKQNMALANRARRLGNVLMARIVQTRGRAATNGLHNDAAYHSLCARNYRFFTLLFFSAAFFFAYKQRSFLFDKCRTSVYSHNLIFS